MLVVYYSRMTNVRGTGLFTTSPLFHSNPLLNTWLLRTREDKVSPQSVVLAQPRGENEREGTGPGNAPLPYPMDP